VEALSDWIYRLDQVHLEEEDVRFRWLRAPATTEIDPKESSSYVAWEARPVDHCFTGRRVAWAYEGQTLWHRQVLS